MAKLFANSGDPDQTPRSAASDLGLHCLPITILGVSRLQCVNSLLYFDNISISPFHCLLCLKTTRRVANSVCPEQTSQSVASDLGLHSLLMPVMNHIFP